MLKLAFLFLTIGDVHHETLWKDFFAGHEKQYAVAIHSKNPLTATSFFAPYELPTKTPTSWSHTMRAQIALLRYALLDPLNEKFIFLSESTIPLQDFDTVYATLLNSPESMFHFMPNPHAVRNVHEYNPQKHRNLHPLPAHKQYKNSQWIILNRAHAQRMVEDETMITLTDRYGSDQEHYPATFLVHHGLADEIMPLDMTYVGWDCAQPPYIFTDFTRAEDKERLERALRDGYLFARKIAPTCNLDLLVELLPSFKSGHLPEKSAIAAHPAPAQEATAQQRAADTQPCASSPATPNSKRATLNNHEYHDEAITFISTAYARSLLD